MVGVEGTVFIVFTGVLLEGRAVLRDVMMRTDMCW